MRRGLQRRRSAWAWSRRYGPEGDLARWSNNSFRPLFPPLLLKSLDVRRWVASPLIEWLFSTEKLSHDDTAPSVYVIVPESVVILAITRRAQDGCRAIGAARIWRDLAWFNKLAGTDARSTYPARSRNGS
jgi:hypothetical protein